MRTHKRHLQQFTDQERALAEDIRQDIIENGRKSISDHCQDAMDETGASVYDLAESLRHGIIIELLPGSTVAALPIALYSRSRERPLRIGSTARMIDTRR